MRHSTSSPGPGPGGARALTSLALALVTGCANPASSSHDPRLAVTDAEAWISGEAARLKAREFPVTRLEAEGDLDGDGRSDHAWVYRLDSAGATETFQQFLAVQTAADPRHIRSLLVGQSGGRSVSDLRIYEGKAELQSQEYLPADQSCCPTGHAVLRFVLRSGQLQRSLP